jgi:hypothetical protein
MPSIVVGGSLAQRQGYGGHAWALLNYLLGFRSLGYEVLFLDRLTPEMATDASGAPSEAARDLCVSWLVETMESVGLGDSYSLLLGDGRQSVGLPRADAIERVRQSVLLLNVMGFVDDEEVLEAAPRRVFLDIDPGFGQMWRELGLHDPFAGHDAFLTVGEGIGGEDCAIPTCGLDWIATPQPIALEHWPCASGGTAITSVGSWRGPYDPVEYDGKRFGLRAHELRKLAGLPRMVEAEIELALEIDPADSKDIELLRENGWALADPRKVAGDPWSYRRYIQGSRAELMVAKGMYVETRSGWFSERSIGYLASGKPVIAQDTGFSERYPCGEGLIAYSDLEGARAGIEEVSADWARHSTAAREIAEEHFDARKVLSRLLANLGVA